MLLGAGVIAASTSAILIRYATEADALAISFWRCALGAISLAPFALRRLPTTGRGELVTSTIAGVFLAVHFATWIASLDLTTVAASVLLVSTTPVFVAAASWLLFRQRLTPVAWSGIALALVGTALIAGLDLGGTSFEGNVLALIGGAMAAGYVLAGETARRTLGILQYAVVAYTVAVLVLLPLCLVSGVEMVAYEASTWLAIGAIVAGPQLLGHTVINFVLADIDATTVAVAIMAEPVIATALAFVLFDEVPSALIYPGGAAILLGIYLVSSTARAPRAVPVE